MSERNYPKPVAKLVKITPKMAAEWLEQSKRINRNMPKTKLEQYTATMAGDEWDINGDTICFDWNDDLLNGTTRLTACVAANTPFHSFVVTGLDPNVFRSYDIGCVRRPHDFLAIQGEKYCAILAGGLAILARLEKGVLGNMTTGASSREVRMNPTQQAELLDRHPDIRKSAEWASNHWRFFKGITPSQYTFLHYQFHRVNAERADTFLEQVLTGESMKATEPAMVLRNRLIENAKSLAKLDKTYILAWTIKAWRAFLADEKMQKVSWKHNEGFPNIDPSDDKASTRRAA